VTLRSDAGSDFQGTISARGAGPLPYSMRKEMSVLTIRAVSDKPCFICGNKDKTAEVSFSDKTFRGVLCMTHVYEKIKAEKEVARAPGEAGSRAAEPVRK